MSLVERGAAVGQKNLSTLQLMQAPWAEWELGESADAVHICRQSKAWGQAIRRIYIAFGMGFRDEDEGALGVVGAGRRGGEAWHGAGGRP